MTTLLSRIAGPRVRTLLAAGCVVATGSAAEAPSVRPMQSFVDDAMAELGFDPAQKSELLAGKVVSVGVADVERQPNELAIGAVMMLVPRPLEVVAEALVSDTTFRVDSDVVAYRLIGDGRESREKLVDAFTDVAFSDKERAEASMLARVRAGHDFNLSRDEIAAFRSLGDAESDARTSVSSTMADVLRGRFLAYLENGLEGVEPYARSGRKTASPRRELTVAFSSLELLERYFPEFRLTLLRYPDQLHDDTRSRFYWIKRQFGGRPTFVLAHRLEKSRDDFVIAAELHYYVEHSYNSMLALIACVPTADGTLVLSISRIFTDQVTGVGSGLKKKIGRQQIVKATAEHFAEMRAALQKPSGIEP